jgi:hypothetical protein
MSVPVPLLQEKTLHFWKKFSEVESDFTANAGWLDHWT